MSFCIVGFLVPALILPPILPRPALTQDLSASTDASPSVEPRDRRQIIDVLLRALKAAPDDISAKAIEGRIWAVWTSPGNEVTSLLMGQAKYALDNDNYELALRMLDSAIEIEPDFTEAWNRRATIYFLKRVWQFTSRSRNSVDQGAAPLRGAIRAWPHHGGDRQQQASP
jgi:tetratricopeptide (TPR) repeat protein